MKKEEQPKKEDTPPPRPVYQTPRYIEDGVPPLKR